ncbi:MAG: hypothetical protein JEZ14_08585 [Marinilabiliaceae bacterium]|nr:hypothetical protein [Marinilabiliaceae bacterium]
MKTSRILFIAYFSAIGLFLMGITIMGFAYNDKSCDDFHRDHYEEISENLASFKHIYVDKDCDVNITKGDRSYFTYNIKNAEEHVKPVFDVRNDTLFIQNVSRHVTIHFNELKSLSGHKCEVGLNSFELSKLAVHMKQAELKMGNDVTISSLEVVLKESSTVRAWGFNTKKLSLLVDDSQFMASSDLKLDLVKGTIRNNSTISINAAKSIQLDLDDSSQLQMR